MSWEDITNDDEFKAQPPEIREQVARNYFQKHIVSDRDFQGQSASVRSQVEQNFYKSAGIDLRQKRMGQAEEFREGLTPQPAPKMAPIFEPIRRLLDYRLPPKPPKKEKVIEAETEPTGVESAETKIPPPMPTEPLLPEEERARKIRQAQQLKFEIDIEKAPAGILFTPTERAIKIGQQAIGAGLRASGALLQKVADVDQYIKDNEKIFKELPGPHLPDPLEVVAKTIKPETIEKAARFVYNKGEEWYEGARQANPDEIDDFVASAVGEAVPGIAEFMLNVPWAAISSAAEAHKEGKNEAWAAVKGAAERYIIGKIFHFLGRYSKAVQVPAMGALFGAQAKLEGATPEEAAKSAITGLAYGVVGGKGRKEYKPDIETKTAMDRGDGGGFLAQVSANLQRGLDAEGKPFVLESIFHLKRMPEVRQMGVDDQLNQIIINHMANQPLTPPIRPETPLALPIPEGLGETFQMREPPPRTIRRRPEPTEPEVFVKRGDEYVRARFDEEAGKYVPVEGEVITRPEIPPTGAEVAPGEEITAKPTITLEKSEFKFGAETLPEVEGKPIEKEKLVSKITGKEPPEIEYRKYVEDTYGKDWRESEEFRRDEEQAKADLKRGLEDEIKGEIATETNATKEEVEALSTYFLESAAELEKGISITDEMGGRATIIPTENGKVADIVNINAGKEKRRGFMENTIKDLNERGFESIRAEVQTTDSQTALNRLVEKGALINPREPYDTEAYGASAGGPEKYPTLFDINGEYFEKGKAVAEKTVPLEEVGVKPTGEAGKIWEQGLERPFEYDPNSTKNEGRFRLFPPSEIKKNTYFRRKSSTEGISYVMGKNKAGETVIQAIRFDKRVISEKNATTWWENNKQRFPFFKEEKPLSVVTEAESLLASQRGELGDAINKYYEEGKKREKEYKSKGEITLPSLDWIKKPDFTIGKRARTFLKGLKEHFKGLRFFSDVPMEFRNAVRIDVVGAVETARDNVFNKVATALWGGAKKADIEKSVELIFARDQLSRAKLDKGNPNMTIADAEKILANVEKGASADAISAADRWKDINKLYQQDLIKRGLLDEDQVIEDYAPHFVVDYTPDWIFNVGIPTRLRRPFRGYIKKAVGTTKEYRKDAEALLGSLLRIEHDNIIEDFISKQTKKYDILPDIPKEKRIEFFGEDAAGRARKPRPGRIYTIDGERYRAYTPDIPFSRQLFPTEDGLIALGGFKNVSLLPERITNAFRNFSARGNAFTYHLNMATGYWKSMAILSHFPSFNINNMIGDTWMAMTQHPRPLRLLAEEATALKYLTGKGEGKYYKDLDAFIKKHHIIMGTFIAGELPRIRKSYDPVRFLLRKSYQLSEFRESINRTAYASTLLKAMQKGEGEQMRKAHSWIDTEGLKIEDAMGKIARDTLIDYGWVSKGFKRYIRGGLFPFSTWYFKGSALVWKWTQKNFGKALITFLGLPVLAAAFNNRSDDTKKLESKLPDYIRHRVHLVLGENPDGSVRTWSFQFPQDALIGTKIFSVAVDYANRVYNKEMPVKEAAQKTIKEWLGREAKGIAYLTTPFIRFIQGLIQQRDPYDGAPIYSTDPRYLTGERKAWEQLRYFIKSSVPFLAVSIQNYQRGLPQDVGFKRLIENVAGRGALGIYDVNKKEEIKIGGRTYTWDEIQDINLIRNKEMGYLGRLEDKFVASGLYPAEFIKSDAARKELKKIFNLYSKHVPQIAEITDENEQVRVVMSMLGRRIKTRLTDSSTMRKWYQVKLERAKTEDEKRAIGAEYQRMRQRYLWEQVKKEPVSARTIDMLERLNKDDPLLEIETEEKTEKEQGGIPFNRPIQFGLPPKKEKEQRSTRLLDYGK